MQKIFGNVCSSGPASSHQRGDAALSSCRPQEQKREQQECGVVAQRRAAEQNSLLLVPLPFPGASRAISNIWKYVNKLACYSVLFCCNGWNSLDPRYRSCYVANSEHLMLKRERKRWHVYSIFSVWPVSHASHYGPSISVLIHQHGGEVGCGLSKYKEHHRKASRREAERQKKKQEQKYVS